MAQKLGLIAGGGELPVALAEHLRDSGADFYVARIAPYADPALDAFPGATHNVGAIGARIDALREAGCDAVAFIGIVPRPNLADVQLDAKGLELAPKIAEALRSGDDGLLRALIAFHTEAGLRVIGADTVISGLRAPKGALGACAPNDRDLADIAYAARVVEALGALDVGQGAVACDGVILAVEAQEGTDAMLARVASLPEAIRGGAQARRGVLVKRAKPGQDRRIDMPVIGLATIERAAEAGLAGVALEENAALIVRKAAVIEAADRAAMFVYGFSPGDIDRP